MDSLKRRVTVPLLSLLLVVFCAAFFLGRNTVSDRLLIETERPVQTAENAARSLPMRAPEAEPVTAETEEGRIDLNTADADELTELPGIGQTLAERIIAYREQYGGFSAAEQIMDVPGIGRATYEKLEWLITVEDGR